MAAPPQEHDAQHVPVLQKNATQPGDIEGAAKHDPLFAVERQVARQVSLGLHDGKARTFIEETEFISLGSYCGVSCALQAIGLRKSAYPFDWVRSPVDGVIHCFDSDFVDFMTFSGYRYELEHHGYLTARWGGSFWHHKPDDPKIREEFIRRIERMLGFGKVSCTQPRMFVRAVNSTRELDATVRLHQSLQRALPQAQIYLLVLIDMQEQKGAFHVQDCADDILFYRIHKSVWEPPTNIHKCDDPYGEAIAFAIHFWTGRESSKTDAKEVKSIEHVSALCQQFEGGSPATELMAPRPYQGQPITLRRKQQSELPRSSVTSRSVASAVEVLSTPPQTGNVTKPYRALSSGAQTRYLSRLRNNIGHHRTPSSGSVVDPLNSATRPDETTNSMAQGDNDEVRYADVKLPETAKPGDIVYTQAFGRKLRLELPADVLANQLLRLQYMNGVVTLAAAAATITVAAAANVMTADEVNVADSSAPRAVSLW